MGKNAFDNCASNINYSSFKFAGYVVRVSIACVDGEKMIQMRFCGYFLKSMVLRNSPKLTLTKIEGKKTHVDDIIFMSSGMFHSVSL